MSATIRPTFVYVISGVRDGFPCAPCKVGITKDPAGRLAALQTGHPYPLTIVAALGFQDRSYAESVEHAFHAVQADSRMSGEWFEADPLRSATVLCTIVFSVAEALTEDRDARSGFLYATGVMETARQLEAAFIARDGVLPSKLLEGGN